MRQGRAYALVSSVYGAFTLTDGALRTLVLLYLYSEGYRPVELALLFVLYEFFGMVTNLVGGWLGTRVGLRATLLAGLLLQVVACSVLALRAEHLAIALVMACQGLSGIAKDLTKMSSKSFVKVLVPEGDQEGLLRWVTLITGSKNTLKGIGCLVGGLGLEGFGFAPTCWAMVATVTLALGLSAWGLPAAAGKAAGTTAFRSVLSDDARINWLSAARFFLFGARDIWFVVALPVYLMSALGLSAAGVSAALALWIVGYGAVQAAAPAVLRRSDDTPRSAGALAFLTAALLLPVGAIAWGLHQGMGAGSVLLVGLGVFGALFAAGSALHSYLIVAYAESERVALRVGFYYMANAGGRLAGVVLSGLLFQWGGGGQGGFLTCLAGTALFLGLSSLLCLSLAGAEKRLALPAP